MLSEQAFVIVRTNGSKRCRPRPMVQRERQTMEVMRVVPKKSLPQLRMDGVQLQSGGQNAATSIGGSDVEMRFIELGERIDRTREVLTGIIDRIKIPADVMLVAPPRPHLSVVRDPRSPAEVQQSRPVLLAADL